VPELPEVTIFKQYIDATSLHQEIQAVYVKNDFVLKDVTVALFKKAIEGHEFTSVSRHGKFLFVALNKMTDVLVLHFGMTGFLKYYLHDKEEPDHARIIFQFSNNYHLAYVSQRMLGEVRFEKDKSSFLEKRNYGPDAMDDSLNKKVFKDLLKDRKGTIKSVLMNQELVSGIGNEFSDEILFHSQIHPKTKVQDLAQKKVDEIYEQMRVVLQKAIDHNTNYDELKDSFLLAHREKNGKCPKCNSKLNTINVSGRTAYFCPVCQPIN